MPRHFSKPVVRSDGEFFGSIREASRASGLSHSCVANHCNGVSSRPVGYNQWTFRYKGTEEPTTAEEYDYSDVIIDGFNDSAPDRFVSEVPDEKINALVQVAIDIVELHALQLIDSIPFKHIAEAAEKILNEISHTQKQERQNAR